VASNVLFTFPGKMGDCLHQWPVARAWAAEHDQQISVGIDRSVRPIADLLRSQACVKEVIELEGVSGYDVGGQPFDFGWGTEPRGWDEVFHLGFREFPEKGLLRATYDLLPLRTSFDEIANVPSVEPFWSGVSDESSRTCVLHGTKTRPRYYASLIRATPILSRAFSRIFWAGSPSDWPFRSAWNGPPPEMGRVIQEMKTCALVFGCSSSIVSLANAMKAPCLRVGEPTLLPDSVWRNTGPRQWNVDPETDAIEVLERIIAEKRWQIPSAA
jgi:hypothetical protein